MDITQLDPESGNSDASSPFERCKSRVGCLLLLPTLILLCSSALLGTFFLLWLVVIHHTPASILKSAWEEGAFIVDEGSKVNKDGTETANLIGLTISTITTNVVFITAPFLMGLGCYCIAGMWIDAQELNVDDDSGLPTPLQYGLLVKLCSATGLRAIYDGTKYLYFKKPKTVTVPRLVSMTFALAVVIYTISHLISFADLWIHYTASAIVRNTTNGYQPDFDDSLFGVGFNDSNSNLLQAPYIQKIGILIAANTTTSTPNSLSVVTLHDEQDLAIVIPSDVDPRVLWTGPSFGMRATCTNLTPQCLGNSSVQSINYDCTSAGYPGFPTLPNPIQNDAPLASLIPGSVMFFNNTGATPSTIMMEFNWAIMIPNIDCPNTFTSFCSRGIGTGFASCDIEVFNLTVQHRGDGIYGVLDTPELSAPSVAQMVMLPFLYRTTFSQLHMNLLPHILSETDDSKIIAAVNQELSRTALSAFAGILTTVPATNFFLVDSTLVSRYSVKPVLAYISLLFLYSVIAIGIFGWTASIRTSTIGFGSSSSGDMQVDVTKRKRNAGMTTELALVQRHLTDPMIILPSLLHPKLGLEVGLEGMDSTGLFVEDESTTRLVVGVGRGNDVPVGSGRGGSLQFCVRERNGISKMGGMIQVIERLEGAGSSTS